MKKIFQKVNSQFFFNKNMIFILEIWDYYFANKEMYDSYLQVTRYEKEWAKFYKHQETVELNAISYLYETICDRINENIDSIITKMKRDPSKIQKFFEEYINVCLQNDSLQILDSLIVSIFF